MAEENFDNPSHELLTGSRFHFEFGGPGGDDLLISKVSGISITIDAAAQGQPLGCGKNVRTQTQITPAGVSYENLTIEHVTTMENNALLDWYQACHPKSSTGGATEAAESRYSASLVFYNQAAEESIRWNIFNALPVKYTTTQLQAESTDLFKETVEIMHSGLIRVI
ncbi:MAG: phage tail protein [Cyanobacteria bacterium P01_C01_bin.72]